MIKKIDKIFIFIIAFLVFSNFINYARVANITSLNSVHLILLTAVFALYKVWKKPDFSFFHMKLNWWIVFYLCVILFWFILPHNEILVHELRRYILSIMSLFIFMVFIFYDDENTSTVRLAILFTTLLSVFNNIYEFINPTAFFPANSPIGVLGRSAGFYMNPTGSGKIIVLGVVLSLTFLKKQYRSWFFLFSFVGVFLTFSRSAIIIFLIIYFYMIIKKQLDFKYSIFIPILVLMIISMSLPFLTNYIEVTHKGGAKNVINRIMWFTNPVSHEDHSQQERKLVAKKAFDMFAEHPFLGDGLGSTKHWDARVAPHNMYVTYMAEIGLLGLFVYPLLIYLVVWGARGEAEITAGAFTIFMVLIGLLSHMMLSQFYSLFAFVLMANMSYKSRKYSYG